MYGFGYWLPELLSRFELHANAHPGEKESVCAVLGASRNSSSAVQVRACTPRRRPPYWMAGAGWDVDLSLATPPTRPTEFPKFVMIGRTHTFLKRGNLEDDLRYICFS